LAFLAASSLSSILALIRHAVAADVGGGAHTYAQVQHSVGVGTGY